MSLQIPQHLCQRRQRCQDLLPHLQHHLHDLRLRMWKPAGFWTLMADPTAVTENASSIPVPGPQHDPEHYKFRSTWSMQDGIWKKLEDRVPWAKVSKRDITRDGKPVERLVTSFSPDQTVGHRPSIESTSETQRDVKRDAEKSGLPPGRDQPTMSDAQPSAAAGLPAGESQQAGVLAVFCGECGCADQHDLCEVQLALLCHRSSPSDKLV